MPWLSLQQGRLMGFKCVSCHRGQPGSRGVLYWRRCGHAVMGGIGGGLLLMQQSPGVRKKHMMDTADRPVRKFGGKGRRLIRWDVERPLCRGVTQRDSRWLRLFSGRKRKERPYCERWILLWTPDEHNRLLSSPLPMNAQHSRTAKLGLHVNSGNFSGK